MKKKLWTAAISLILATTLVYGSAIAYAAGQAIIPSFASYIENIDYTAKGGGVTTYIMPYEEGWEAFSKYTLLLEEEYGLASLKNVTVQGMVLFTYTDYTGDADVREKAQLTLNGNNGATDSIEGYAIFAAARASGDMLTIQAIYSKDFIVADTGERYGSASAGSSVVIPSLVSFSNGKAEFSGYNENHKEQHFRTYDFPSGSGYDLMLAYIDELVESNPDFRITYMDDAYRERGTVRYGLTYEGNADVGDMFTMISCKAHIIVEYLELEGDMPRAYVRASLGIDFED